MTVISATPIARADLRRALKRGRAREALNHAAAEDADLATLFRLGAELRPNPRSLTRVARRVARLRGVLRVAATADGRLIAVARNLRRVVTRAAATEVFAEEALLYTRIGLVPGRRGTGFALLRAGFCLHALERLVERSTVPLDQHLLPELDAEADRLLRHLGTGEVIEDAGDQFLPARAEGVWAGSLDHSALEADWGLVPTGTTPLPLFSVRTFLGPDQMRPTLWARWRRDPALSVA